MGEESSSLSSIGSSRYDISPSIYHLSKGWHLIKKIVGLFVDMVLRVWIGPFVVGESKSILDSFGVVVDEIDLVVCAVSLGISYNSFQVFHSLDRGGNTDAVSEGFSLSEDRVWHSARCFPRLLFLGSPDLDTADEEQSDRVL